MITVVEERNRVTRMCEINEAEARTKFSNARARMVREHWLAVSMHQIEEPPQRSIEELERAVDMALNLRHNV